MEQVAKEWTNAKKSHANKEFGSIDKIDMRVIVTIWAGLAKVEPTADSRGVVEELYKYTDICKNSD